MKAKSKFKYALYVLIALFLVVLSSSSLSIKAAEITEYDDVSYSSYKGNVEGKTDYDYVNKRNVTLKFNLPSSVDQSKMMVQFVITDSAAYEWEKSDDTNGSFNDVGVKSFDINLPYDENYIHSRMKLYGADIIYTLAIEFVMIDEVAPTAGVVSSESYTLGTWTNQDVTFNISDATDNLSGISSQTYRILKDNMVYTDWQSYVNEEGNPFAITLTQTGVYEIKTKAIDKANNAADGTSVFIKIDKEIPTTGLLISSTTQYWNGEDVIVYVKVGGEDDFGRSGFSHYAIASVMLNATDITTRYASVGSTYNGSELTFTESGRYVLKIRGYDVATNYYEYVYEFGIDKVNQSLSLSQAVTDKAVVSALINVTKGAFDGYSETKYYYMHGEYSADDFIADNEFDGVSATVLLNGYYTFASIDEVGNIFVTTISINNIITTLSVVYDGLLSQVVGDLSPIRFTAMIDVNASTNNIYWFVDNNIRKRGGNTFDYTPPAAMGTYKVQARINSDAHIVSVEFAITVSINAATYIKIDYVEEDLTRTYGDESSIELVAVVDAGASAESAAWYINGQSLGIGEAINVPYDKIKDAGEYEISIFLIGENTLTDKITVVVNPLEIVVVPIAVSKLYGTEDPELNYTVSKLLYGDLLEGKLEREEGEDEGDYLITLGTLAHPNYNIILYEEPVYFSITSYDIDVVVTYYGYYNAVTQTYKKLDQETFKVGVNKEFTGEIKTFEGYHEYDGEAITITVTDDVHVIDYYYTAVEYEVVINHVSARDNSVVLASETKTVCIDQEITVYTKTISGYSINNQFVKFIMDGVTKEYTITYNPVEVNINVKHIGYEGRVLDTEVVQSWFGLTIKIPYKIFTGYSSPSDYFTYIISNEKNNMVNLSYIPNRYDITIHHVNENRVKIHEDTVLQLQEFDSTATLYPIFIEGYIATVEKGTYTVNSALFNEFTFVYRQAIKPIITLIGDSEILINIDQVERYTDEKAFVNDYFSKDKQISGVWRGTAPTYTKIGTFYLDYNYINEDGLTADTVTRVIVIYDKTAPIITVGIEEETIIVGTEYDFYAGINYSDNYDSNDKLTITYQTDLDINLIGTYTITYTVKDTSGNTATATRIVHVKNAKTAGGSFPIVPVIIGGAVGVLGIIAAIIFITMKKKKGATDTTATPEKKENEGEKK